MTIRESIRKAIREAKSSQKWSPDSQPNLYDLDTFLKKSGYRLVDVISHEESDELVIESMDPGRLHPDIIHDIAEGGFYAKVEGYGLLNSSDVEEIIEGYNTALGVLQYLDSLDLSELEIQRDED